MRRSALLALCAAIGGASVGGAQKSQAGKTWTADNGNGTFSNPLFYDEFSDPDLIRVGDEYYLTGTTMHAMPGLPVLHSRDLVNWEFMSYALDRLDISPAYRLEGGNSYGQGIWAPSFRYLKGTFHIFSNVNRQATQHFTATNPRGPWTQTSMKKSFHDLSVLFDDDGAAYIIWGYQDIHFARLDSTLSDVVPGSERTLFARNAGMGEGSHFYKIDGKYYITSAWYAGRMRLAAARADHPEGPYEVNKEISADETFGLREGHRVRGNGNDSVIVVTPPNPTGRGHMSMHQGGIVRTPAGEWWGFSMMDANSVGRLTALSPVTWKDGWPYFGLPGNLGRSPRVWLKPKTNVTETAHAPYVRSDAFSGPRLANVWQWNHVPDDAKWSLTERSGFLRLHSLPSSDFWMAKNSLTQRAIGPQSSATTALDASGLHDNDVAGLALLNRPYAWIGVRRSGSALVLQQYDQTVDSTITQPLTTGRVWLRADADFLSETATFSFSTDGTTWTTFGRPFTMAFQLKTFQGVRFALFNYNTAGAAGGAADFDFVNVDEAHPRGFMQPIPTGRTITLRAAGRDTPFTIDGRARFTVVDRGLGRVALRAATQYLSVTAQSDSTSSVSLKKGQPGDRQTFQWIETLYGDLALMSLRTHRYLRLEPDGRVSSDSRGPEPDPNDGTALRWRVVTASR
ncbi:MAG: family 43 glycosylhydrolase [bacterium]